MADEQTHTANHSTLSWSDIVSDDFVTEILNALESYSRSDLDNLLNPIELNNRTREDAIPVNNFNHLAVEYLLDEVSEMLERCIQHRRVRNIISEKAISLIFNLYTDYELQKIENREIDAGKIDTERDVLAISEDFTRRASDVLNSIEIMRTEQLRLSQPDADEMKRRVELTSELVKNASASDRWKEAGELAELLEKHRIYIEHPSYQDNKHQIDSQILANDERLAIASRRKETEETIVKTEREWHELNSNILFQRLRMAFRPGSGLDFFEQISEAETLFNVEWMLARQRIPPILIGLRDVYNLTESPPDISGTGGLSRFVVWIRTILSKIDKATKFDQTIRYSIPVKIDSNNIVARSRESIEVSVPISSIYFQSLSYFRLRAIALRIVTFAYSGPMLAELLVPRQANQIFRTESVPVDQSHVSSIFLASVGNRLFLEEDMNRSKQLFNICPFGDWVVRLTTAKIDQKIVENLDTFEILLEFNAIPKDT